jgi:excisionase family DNA binding protein
LSFFYVGAIAKTKLQWHPMIEKYLVGYQAAAEASGIPVRSLRSMVKAGVLPHTKTGHRTILFRASEIERALRKRTVREVGSCLRP